MVSEEQRQKFGLMSAEKYFYLNQGGSCIIDGKSDKDDYQNLLSAMQVFVSNNVIILCFLKITDTTISCKSSLKYGINIQATYNQNILTNVF